jgi:hypothetical protein
MENKNDPGASKPFNTNWKMDKQKAGFVKIDEEKLNKVKATLARKSKRGTLSDSEYELAKKLDEVLKRRANKPDPNEKDLGPNRKSPTNVDMQSRKVDRTFGRMEKDPTYRPSPFGKDKKDLNTEGLRTDDDYPYPRANETPEEAEVRVQTHRRNTNPATRNNPSSGENADKFEDRKRERRQKDIDTRGY